MGKPSRTKGANGERELVRLLKEMGYEAVRISPLETNHTSKGDVEVWAPGGSRPHYHGVSVPETWEVKRRKKQFSIQQVYDALEGNDALAVRIDGKAWLVVRRLEG